MTYYHYVNKIEEINSFKMKMLASISHEIRTPLNISIGLQQCIQEDLENENNSEVIKLNEFINSIKESKH